MTDHATATAQSAALADRAADDDRVKAMSNCVASSGQPFCDSAETSTDSTLAMTGAALTGGAQGVTDGATSLAGRALDEIGLKMTDGATASAGVANTGDAKGFIDRAGVLAGDSVAGMADCISRGTATLTDRAKMGSTAVGFAERGKVFDDEAATESTRETEATAPSATMCAGEDADLAAAMTTRNLSDVGASSDSQSEEEENHPSQRRA